jgi:hypothetical protein
VPITYSRIQAVILSVRRDIIGPVYKSCATTSIPDFRLGRYFTRHKAGFVSVAQLIKAFFPNYQFVLKLNGNALTKAQCWA